LNLEIVMRKLRLALTLRAEPAPGKSPVGLGHCAARTADRRRPWRL